MDLVEDAKVSSSMLMEGMVGLMFFLGRVASALHTIVDFVLLNPFVLPMRFHYVLMQFQVPFEPLALLPLSGPRLLGFVVLWISPFSLLVEGVQ
jgi:hypothetical protein